MFKVRCACKKIPGLIRVTRVTGMTSEWDVKTFYRKDYEGKTIIASTRDGWYDKTNGEWPISPLCRYRWLPQVKEQVRRFFNV